MLPQLADLKTLKHLGTKQLVGIIPEQQRVIEQLTNEVNCLKNTQNVLTKRYFNHLQQPYSKNRKKSKSSQLMLRQKLNGSWDIKQVRNVKAIGALGELSAMKFSSTLAVTHPCAS